LRRLVDSRLVCRLTGPISGPEAAVRIGLLVAGVAALSVAVLNPRWGQQEEVVVRRNVDVLVLLDVSRSMLARDIAPNRLERAKLALRDDLLPALGGDRIGLLAFAGAPVLVCPLTNDYGFFRLALADVSTRTAPRGGTLIGDAIRKAVTCFPSGMPSSRVILLITDGEDHESFPVEAAAAACHEHKVLLVAVGLGDDREGARIPVPREDGRGETYLEYGGQVVWTRANFEQLGQIAAVSDLNVFVRVGTRNFDLGEIYRKLVLPQLEFQQKFEREAVPLPSQYHPFAVAALVLLVARWLLREGPKRPAAFAFARVAQELAA